MPELGELLRQAGTTDAGFGVDDVERRARVLRRRRTWVSSAAVVVALVLVGAGVVLATGDRRGEETLAVGTTPPVDGTRPVVSPRPLVDLPRELLDAVPVVPEGWQTVTFGLGQLSAPPDWTVWAPGTVTCEPGTKVVALGRDLDTARDQVRKSCGSGGSEGSAGSQATPWLAMVAVRGLGDDCAACPDGSTRGLEIPAARPGTAAYFAQLQLDVTWEGDVDERIPVSLVPSSAARALADGPLADTSDWQVVRVGAVAALAPPGWPVHPLGAADRSPNECRRHVFEATPTVYLGVGGSAGPTCLPPIDPAPRVPADGAWLVDGDTFAAWPDRYRVAVDGASAEGVNRDDPNLVQLQLADPAATVIVGLGEDLAIARTILRTVTTDAGEVDPSTATSTTLVPTTAVPADPDVTGAVTPTTIPAPGGLRATLELPSTTVTAGETLEGRAIIHNDTGQAVNVVSCGSPFKVVLANADVQQLAPWLACAETFTMPPGESSWPIAVAASYLSCFSNPSGAPPSPTACLPGGGPPPLPPGRYTATLVTSDSRPELTASVEVEVTAP